MFFLGDVPGMETPPPSSNDVSVWPTMHPDDIIPFVEKGPDALQAGTGLNTEGKK